jgi:hypothetical protein
MPGLTHCLIAELPRERLLSAQSKDDLRRPVARYSAPYERWGSMLTEEGSEIDQGCYLYSWFTGANLFRFHELERRILVLLKPVWV